MDEDEFTEIYEKYHRMVEKAANNILRSSDLAEDICQEVFMEFTKKAQQMEERGYYQWFLLTARRRAIDFCKKSYQVHEVPVSFSEKENEMEKEGMGWASVGEQEIPSVEDEVIRNLELKNFFSGFCSELKKKNKDWYEIWEKNIVLGEKQEDVARDLGISVENLRTKKHRMKTWIDKKYE